MKNNQYILLIVVGVAVLLLMKKKQDDTQQQTASRGIWGGLVDAIGSTMERGNDSFTRMAQAIYEEKRQNEREDYARLRDTKDNSAIFSNDILLY